MSSELNCSKNIYAPVNFYELLVTKILLDFSTNRKVTVMRLLLHCKRYLKRKDRNVRR